MLQLINEVLDRQVRPMLALHGGGVELLGVEDGVVRIRLVGQCSNCPASSLTTEQLIFFQLNKEFPQVKQVLTEHSVSGQLLAQAKRILQGRNQAGNAEKDII